MFGEWSCFMPLCLTEEGQVHLRHSLGLDTVPFLSVYLEKASDWLVWGTYHLWPQVLGWGTLMATWAWGVGWVLFRKDEEMLDKQQHSSVVIFPDHCSSIWPQRRGDLECQIVQTLRIRDCFSLNTHSPWTFVPGIFLPWIALKTSAYLRLINYPRLCSCLLWKFAQIQLINSPTCLNGQNYLGVSPMLAWSPKGTWVLEMGDN